MTPESATSLQAKRDASRHTLERSAAAPRIIRADLIGTAKLA